MNKTATLLLTAIIGTSYLFGCSSENTLQDPRDGQKYKTVMIDGVRWMVENLNYKTGNSWCYDNDDSKCKQYGRLYDLKTAITACPDGWHLPTSQEWHNLTTAADSGTCNILGGYRTSDGIFNNADQYGYWWVTKNNYCFSLWTNEIDKSKIKANDGYSVRCIQDGNSCDSSCKQSNFDSVCEMVKNEEIKPKEEIEKSPDCSETSNGEKAPYEGITWLKLKEVGGSYVIRNYPSLWNDGETRSPESFRVKGGCLIWITFSDDPSGLVYKLSDITKLNDSSYRFNFKNSNNFKFDYVDKANHIAQWSVYYSDGRSMGNNLYIDSLYNTFPTIDFEWENEGAIEGVSCSLSSHTKPTENDYLIDDRDNKKYKTVKIGDQTWMAENLGYNAKSSKCYENNPANCDKYGRLYDWKTATKACPKGWHLPTKEEFQILMTCVDYDNAGKNLKAKSGWDDYDSGWNDGSNGKSGNGADLYDFSALPGGIGSSNGGFSSIGRYGMWWSSTDIFGDEAYCLAMESYSRFYGVSYDCNGQKSLNSVRCLKDYSNADKAKSLLDDLYKSTIFSKKDLDIGNKEETSKYFSSEMVELLYLDRKCQKEDGKLCKLNMILCNCKDFSDKFSIEFSIVFEITSAKSIQILAKISDHGKISEILFDFVEENGMFKISDMLMNGSDSLKKILKLAYP